MNRYSMKTFERWMGRLADPAAIRRVGAHARLQPRNWQGADDVHRSDLLYFVESGVVGGVIEGERVRFTPGSCVWLPAGLRRQFWNVGEARAARSWRVRMRVVDERGNVVSPCTVPVWRHDAHRVLAYVKLIAGVPRVRGAVAGERVHLLRGLSLEYFTVPERIVERGRHFDINEKDRLDQYLARRAFSPIGPADLAEHMGLTLDYFSRVFRRTYGVKPRTYIKEMRMQAAAQLLLESRMTVSELAITIGQDNLSKFCRQFKEVHGCTPSEYRRRK